MSFCLDRSPDRNDASLFFLPPFCMGELVLCREGGRDLARLFTVASVFAHGLTFERDTVRAVNETIEDCVGNRGVADGVMPQIDGKLAGYKRCPSPLAVIKDLEEIAVISVLERLHAPVINDKQIGLGQPVARAARITTASSTAESSEVPPATAHKHLSPTAVGWFGAPHGRLLRTQYPQLTCGRAAQMALARSGALTKSGKCLALLRRFIVYSSQRPAWAVFG
jgi:hypothetical protein